MGIEMPGCAEEGAEPRASLLAPREDVSYEDQAWERLVSG